MFMALKWVQSQADYNNVMAFDVVAWEKKGNKELNEKDVINFFRYRGTQIFFYTYYGEKLTLLHNNLPVLLTRMSHLKPFLTSLCQNILP